MEVGFGDGGGDWFGPASFASCEDEDDDEIGGEEGEGSFNRLEEVEGVEGRGEGEGEELLSGDLTTKTSPWWPTLAQARV